MNYLKRRFKEPSTWAGLAAICGALLPIVGVPVATAAAIVSAMGGVAIIVREPGNPPAP